MTDSLIRSLARRPAGALARPSMIALYTLLLSALGSVWLWWVARGEGAVADARLLPWETAAFAAIVALPLIGVGVWFATLVTRHVLAATGAEERRGLASAVFAAAVAVSSSAGLSVAWFVTGMARDIQGGAFELLPLFTVAQLALMAMPALLLVSGILTALVASRRPWAAPDVASWRTPVTRVGRLALGGALAGIVALPALLIGGPITPQASAGNTVCAQGAPQKLYVVRAISLTIPLNRFGDFDANGRMYVLEGYWDSELGVPRPNDGAAFNTNPATNPLATGNLAKVRAQEASRHVSPGLGDDPIQPLIIRANLGDCVTIRFTNAIAAGDIGMRIDGLAHQTDSSGDAIGQNVSSAVATGEEAIYTYNIPKDDPGLEGTRYIRPGPGNRDHVAHGLFGALVVEPEGSKYLSNYEEGVEIVSGWEAIIDVPASSGKKDFREHVKLFHEIGDEKFLIQNAPVGTPIANATNVPMKDPVTTSYRPAARAINYRAEPFMNRLLNEPRAKSLAYNSYTFGDPATPILKGYVGDPTKIRILHAGGEMLHVYHLHGGGIRWRMNPQADATFDYGDTGLKKVPAAENSDSLRLDSQSFGPGESYELEIESGAGGTQQAAGELLFHCHIAEHYLSGMWGFWRIYDTLQPGVAALPDRTALPAAVDSTQLIGKTMPDGTTLTAGNIDDWIRPQLPSQGVPTGPWEDNSVWDWRVKSTPAGPVYLGAPENAPGFPNLFVANDITSPWDTLNLPGSIRPGEPITQGPGFAIPNGAGGAHTSFFPGDIPDTLGAESRPRILFNPVNGRPAHALLRPQILKRAPFSGNGHTGAPYLGEKANQPRDPLIPGPQPFANRPDGMCPSNAPVKRFNLVSVEINQQVTSNGQVDPGGKIYTLAKNKAAVAAGEKREPLFIRMNTGDCGFITLTSEQVDNVEQPYSMTSAHIHHVQFDPQASDGVGAGLSYGQAVRPYKIEDRPLVSAVAAGATQITLTAVKAAIRPGVWIGVGLGTEDIEIMEVASVSGTTITLKKPLQKAHAAGQYAGTEFLQSVWYPDVALDNIFWHDHVDGIHNWGHGLVSQLIIEPKGSTYHDPKTGEQVDSGAVVDIRTSNPLIPGVLTGSFREFALLTIDSNGSGVDSTINLRAEPVLNRLGPGGNPDPSLAYSSYTHGDPYTVLPRAYRGDPVVIRSINVSPGVDTFEIDGHRFALDPRLRDAQGRQAGSPTSAMVYGVSERFTLVLQGGAGGILNEPGDYLYRNGIGRRFMQGAWGLIRVLDREVADLKRLPGTNVPTGALNPPVQTGGRPPESASPGNPCPTSAPSRKWDVSAVDLPVPAFDPNAPIPVLAPLTSVYTLTSNAAAVKSGTQAPEPLVLHAAQGDCIEVTLTNQRAAARASFHVSELTRTVRSSGVNAGFTPEQTVAPGQSRVYRLYADDARVGAAIVSDFGGVDTGPSGLYGAVVVSPKGAVFRDPVTGEARDVGTQIDVLVPGQEPYRNMTAIVADDDDIIGGDFTPYAPVTEGPNYINYKNEGVRGDTALTFSSNANGDPGLVFRALPGDRTKVHVLGAPGSEQPHVFSIGGHTWYEDAAVKNSELITADRVSAGTSFEAELQGGAGGKARAAGDYFVGDLRRPFTQAGVWGILRVLPDPTPATPAGIKQLSDPFPASLSIPAPDPAATPPGGPNPGQPAPLQATPSPPAPPASPKVIEKIRDLTVPSRLSLQALYGKGLTLTMRGPADLTGLTVRIKPAAGTRGGQGQVTLKMAQRATPGRSALTRAADGTVKVWWKVPARVISRLKPGKYTVMAIGPTGEVVGSVRLFDEKGKNGLKSKATKGAVKAKKTA